MELAYRGSVNRWECDENDHLNVRFYMQRHCQTLSAGLASRGVGGVSHHFLSQHVRFFAESRIATPLSGYWGLVSNPQAPGGWCFLTELRHSFTHAVVSSCLHLVDAKHGADEETIKETFQETAEELDPAIGPRGLAQQDSVFSKLDYAALTGHGFRLIGTGQVDSQEVDTEHRLLVHNYMARLSDSMPHLWNALHEHSGGLPEGQGGAVLEYRLRYLQPLMLHHRFEVWSGLVAAGPKVQQFEHLIFNPDNRQLVLSAQAIGVRMDLVARRAVVLSEALQAQMQSACVTPPGAV